MLLLVQIPTIRVYASTVTFFETEGVSDKTCESILSFGDVWVYKVWKNQNN